MHKLFLFCSMKLKHSSVKCRHGYFVTVLKLAGYQMLICIQIATDIVGRIPYPEFEIGHRSSVRLCAVAEKSDVRTADSLPLIDNGRANEQLAVGGGRNFGDRDAPHSRQIHRPCEILRLKAYLVTRKSRHSHTVLLGENVDPVRHGKLCLLCRRGNRDRRGECDKY